MGSVNDTRYYPEAWHLKPTTCPSPFINISGWTFIFESSGGHLSSDQQEAVVALP